MSDTPSSPPQTPPSGEHEIEVDLAAFLPDGVELAGDEDVDSAADEGRPLGAVEPEPGVAADGADDAHQAHLTEDADGASPAERPAVDTAALEQIELDLAAVDAALAALDAATYGRCASCGEPIDDDLLAAEPTRLTCAQH